MSNEEILLKLAGLKTSAYWEKEVLAAMDAARNDEAIAFNKWRQANWWDNIDAGEDGCMYWRKHGEDDILNDEQLYQLFKSQDNK